VAVSWCFKPGEVGLERGLGTQVHNCASYVTGKCFVYNALQVPAMPPPAAHTVPHAALCAPAHRQLHRLSHQTRGPDMGLALSMLHTLHARGLPRTPRWRRPAHWRRSPPRHNTRRTGLPTQARRGPSVRCCSIAPSWGRHTEARATVTAQHAARARLAVTGMRLQLTRAPAPAHRCQAQRRALTARSQPAPPCKPPAPSGGRAARPPPRHAARR